MKNTKTTPHSVRDEWRLIRVAALLHDIGHYPFSHALEEIERCITKRSRAHSSAEGEVGAVLRRELGADAPERIVALIRGRSASPLQGLISGSIDLDKLDYLRRDAFMCGVSYGEIDVDRLINALTLVRDPDTGTPTVGMVEKGLSALESLLFAKYQMYRNVYVASRRSQRDCDVQAPGRRRTRRRRAWTPRRSRHSRTRACFW